MSRRPIAPFQSSTSTDLLRSFSKHDDLLLPGQLQAAAAPPPPKRVPPRRLSLPDLKDLREEWARREALQKNELPPGKLQVDLLNIRTDIKVKRPVIRLRMGPQRYFSSRSKDQHGNWNEGFLFTISYHNQLFDTIELDLFDKRNGWRSKTRHIGKAKLRLSVLNGRQDVFLTFLPMYEYHTRRYLPAHIQLPHNFLKTHIPRFRTQEHVQYQQQHPSHRKHSMTPLIGSIQVRIRYTYQNPPDAEFHHLLSPIYNEADNLSFVSSHLDRATLSSSYSSRSKRSAGSVRTTSSRRSVFTQGTIMTNGTYSLDEDSSNDDDNDENTRSSDNDNHSEHRKSAEEHGFHDAVEPKLVYLDDMKHVSTDGETPKSGNTVCSQSSIDLVFKEHLQNKLARRTESTRRMDVGGGGGFGFSRSDAENRLRRKQSQSSIKSHNFGDKNFAFRWINESFEEVALAHPSRFCRFYFLIAAKRRRKNERLLDADTVISNLRRDKDSE